MKILLVRNDNLGDLICTTPAIEALRKKYPEAQIDIVVNSYNYLAIRKNPFVNRIYLYTKPEHKTKFLDKVKALCGKLQIMGKIFREKYDVCIVFRGTYSPYAEQFSLVSRAKVRIGVKNPSGKDYFTHHVNSSESMHEVEFCFECVRPLGVKYQGERPFFFVEEELVERFKHLGIEVLFHISARKPKNRLSFKKLKRIFKKFQKEDIKIFFTAAPEDFSLARALSGETKGIFVKTKNFLELAGVIKNTKVFVSLDGGAVHLGPALGVKTVALFGSTSLERWHPWGYKELTLKSPTGRAEDIPDEAILEKVKSCTESFKGLKEIKVYEKQDLCGNDNFK